MTRHRKYMFLFPLKCLSFKCQVVNQQLKQCLSLMLKWNTGPYLQQKKLQNNNTLESTYFVLKDISIHNCCQAKQMYLFLAFPHTKLVLVLNIIITVQFINFAKITESMPGCLYCFEPFWKHPHKKLLRPCTKLSRILQKTCYWACQRKTQQCKNFPSG